MSDRILLTGATGFLGSHIAEDLVRGGFEVIAPRRRESDLWRCMEFADKMIWFELDNGNWDKAISGFEPTVVVHCAWEGVGAVERDNWKVQLRNIISASELTSALQKRSLKKLVVLGSQAEYGNFHGRVSEEHICAPVSAYGIAKLFVQKMMWDACVKNNIQFFWLRLFSIFGPREGDNWLIPQVIKSLLANRSVDLTKAEQQYDYLYVKDLAKAVSMVVESSEQSGVYNIGSNRSVKLRDLLESLKKAMPTQAGLNFGVLPYRQGQQMHVEGDSSRFFRTFGFYPTYELRVGLEETIDYYTAARCRR